MDEVCRVMTDSGGGGHQIALVCFLGKDYYSSLGRGGAGHRLAIALVQWHVVVDRSATIKADHKVGDESYALAA